MTDPADILAKLAPLLPMTRKPWQPYEHVITSAHGRVLLSDHTRGEDTTAIVDALNALPAIVAERAELIDLVRSLVAQGCSIGDDGTVDSCAISTYADALHALESLGLFKVETSVGRRVIGRWFDAAR